MLDLKRQLKKKEIKDNFNVLKLEKKNCMANKVVWSLCPPLINK